MLNPGRFKILLIVSILLGCNQQGKEISESIQLPANENNKVFVVVIDGPRWDHTFGDSLHNYIPFLAELSKKGTLYTNFYNLGDTYTNAGHTVISTGEYESIDNLGRYNPSAPSFLHKYLSLVPDSTKAWIIASKDKLEVLKFCEDTLFKLNPSADCGIDGNGSGYRDDIKTFSRFKDILLEHNPEVALLNFREPDYSAHFGDFEGYFRGLQISDSLVNEIYEILFTKSEYKGKTSLIITNDHGRHLDDVKDGLRSHGDNCSGCRRIFLLGLGPGFEKGVVIQDSMDLSIIHDKVLAILTERMN